MIKKNKNLLISAYISLIIPLIITYLFPLMYVIILDKGKSYYSTAMINGYTWVLAIASVILIASTYANKNKQLVDIIYYVIGMIIGIASNWLLFIDRNSVFAILANQIRFVFITGYLLLILCIVFQTKTENKKTISKEH